MYTVYYQCRRYTTIYYLLSFIIITKKRQLLPFIFAVLKLHKQQGADIINRYHAEVFAYRVYISITEIFAHGYRPLSRDRASERVSGSVNYTLYEEIATAGSCRNPENRVAGSNARLPARSSVQSGSRRREFQLGPDCWPRAASRFLSPPSRLPALALSNARRFTILHYRSTNYNPQITFGVYSTGTAPR